MFSLKLPARNKKTALEAFVVAFAQVLACLMRWEQLVCEQIIRERLEPVSLKV